MTKAFALIRMVGGSPDIGELPYFGYVLCDRIGATNWGAYLISGTGAQLSAIDALPSVMGIVAVTQAGDVRWAELDDNIAGAARTKLNNWLTARFRPTIPAGWTNRRVVREIYQAANAHWNLASFDIRGPEDV